MERGGHGWRWGEGPPRSRPWPRPFLAIFIGTIQVLGTTLAAQTQPEATQLDPLGYALLSAGPFALAWMRRFPLTALIVNVAATTWYLIAGYPGGPYFVATVIALFTAVRYADGRIARALCVAGYIAFVLATDRELADYLAVAAWTLVAFALAGANKVRGERFAEMMQARQEQARRQASDERLRIARELHDVLGHHLSLINVRAGVALHLLDSEPEQAREALGAIKLASSEALREVRGVLSALYPDGESAPRSPAPGLADLDRLVTETRDAGLAVTVEHDGPPRPVPGEVDRAAYRIVQEALTNVRRHAGPAAKVTIVLGYGDGTLTLRIDDTGTGRAPSTPDGNGIPGMRERAAALGGTLAVAPAPDGGFRVEARLPVAQWSQP